MSPSINIPRELSLSVGDNYYNDNKLSNKIMDTVGSDQSSIVPSAPERTLLQGIESLFKTIASRYHYILIIKWPMQTI